MAEFFLPSVGFSAGTGSWQATDVAPVYTDRGSINTCGMQVISGGQTGVDRAALDAAMTVGLSHGGWCPKGRLAEDGSIPNHYDLMETASRFYAERTEQNVMDATATLILFRTSMTGGTKFTFQMAKKHSRPCLCIDLENSLAVDEAVAWICSHHVKVLNVAGPRESSAPGIRDQAFEYLRTLFLQTTQLAD